MADLAARYVCDQNAPRYPTKLEVVDMPNLLRRHVPAAWLGRREIAGALGAFLAAGAGGCHATTTEIQPAPAIKHPAPVGTVIAPVFDRSERVIQVSSGPVAAYLTEEEGLQIVLQELQRCGLNMSLSDVQFGTDEQPLRIDLMDPDRRVAVEFFSESDISGDNPRDRFLADLRPRALNLASSVAEQGNDIYFGVIYDPATFYYVGRGTRPWKEYEEAEKKALEKSKQILREQVKSFTDWLAAQGVI